MAERWPTTTSVALLLENGRERDQLVLVRKRDTAQWGLIAGGLDQGEDFVKAVWRELREETGLDQSRVEIKDRIPTPLAIPGEQKTSVGILFKGHMITPLADGYETRSKEIDFVKAFKIKELEKLLRDDPNKLYKPEFNLRIIDYWIEDHFDFKYSMTGLRKPQWRGEKPY